MGKRPPIYTVKYTDVGQISVLYTQSNAMYPIAPIYNSSYCAPSDFIAGSQHNKLGGVLYVPHRELVGA